MVVVVVVVVIEVTVMVVMTVMLVVMSETRWHAGRRERRTRDGYPFAIYPGVEFEGGKVVAGNGHPGEYRLATSLRLYLSSPSHS